MQNIVRRIRTPEVIAKEKKIKAQSKAIDEFFTRGIRKRKSKFKCVICGYPVADKDMLCGECACEDDGYCD